MHNKVWLDLFNSYLKMAETLSIEQLRAEIVECERMVLELKAKENAFRWSLTKLRNTF